MRSSHLILGRPLLLLPPIPPSIRVFSNESTLRMRWPKYWSFSFSRIVKKSQVFAVDQVKKISLTISPSNEHPRLVSFRMDWLELLAVQGRRLSSVFSNSTVQTHQFFGTQPSGHISPQIFEYTVFVKHCSDTNDM